MLKLLALIILAMPRKARSQDCHRIICFTESYEPVYYFAASDLKRCVFTVHAVRDLEINKDESKQLDFNSADICAMGCAKNKCLTYLTTLAYYNRKKHWMMLMVTAASIYSLIAMYLIYRLFGINTAKVVAMPRYYACYESGTTESLDDLSSTYSGCYGESLLVRSFGDEREAIKGNELKRWFKESF